VFGYQTNDGVIIDGVTNVPEFAMVTEARETTMCCIAVMCHELGHLVGLPDLYTGSRTDWGPGYWSLMSYGAWARVATRLGAPRTWTPGARTRPASSRPTLVTTNLYDVRIPDVETHPVCYKVWRNGRNTDTCFYLENRQQKGSTRRCPAPARHLAHRPVSQRHVECGRP